MEIKVGKNLLSITEECADTKELFKKAGFYGTIPSKCGNCEGTDLMLNHRCAQDKYDYYSVDCKECNHRLNYGQHLNDDTLFAKLNDGWEPPYNADGEEEGPKKKSSGKSALQKAKAAKAKKAEAAEEDESDYEDSSAEEEAEEKPVAKKKSRSDILAKFGKKKASA